MNTIIVIGTNPPCPRCGLLENVMKRKVLELNLDAEVIHWTYTDEEAKNYAKNLGLESGTAKDVAKRTGQNIDQNRLAFLMVNNQSAQNLEYKDYNNYNWSYELDEIIRPFENKAKECQLLMTPAIIINGELKHQGSVPRIEKINHWLYELNA